MPEVSPLVRNLLVIGVAFISLLPLAALVLWLVRRLAAGGDKQKKPDEPGGTDKS